MPFPERAELSSLYFGVRERMKEKKNGVLKTAKLNASLAAKIRTKTINNSSIIKVSLKQNNKALALALSAAKIAAQRLTDDKMLLQKEVELCHFENACLRQKLTSVNKCIDELYQFMNSHLEMAMKLSRLSENGSCSSLLADGRLSETDDRQDNDKLPVRAAPMSMRILLSQVDDKEDRNDGGMAVRISTSLPTLPSSTAVPAFGKSQRSVPVPALEKISSSNLTEKLPSNEKNGQKLTEVNGVSAFDPGTIFKDISSSVLQSSRSSLLFSLNDNSPAKQLKETTRPCSDSTVLSQRNVTERKKRRTDLSSASSTNDLTSHSPHDLSDNVLLDDLQWTKEMDPAAQEYLEVSQIGELMTLKAKNKSYGKIKANETRALKKVFTGTEKELDFMDLKAPEPTCHTEIKKNAHLKNLEDLLSQFQSPVSDSLSNKASLDACSTQPLVCCKMEIPSQEQIRVPNVKRKKAKKMTQEMNASLELTEADAQSLEGNTSQSQPQIRKTKKDSQDKMAKVGRDNAQREHFGIGIDNSDRSKIAPKVKKRGGKDLTGKSNPANAIPLLSVIGSPQPTLPVSLDGEDTCLNSACRNSIKIFPKVQISSAIQNHSLNKASVSSGKMHWDVNSHVIGLKKQENFKPKLNRKTYTVKDVNEECAASDFALQSAEESKTSQVNRTRWSFLHISDSRTQQVSFLMDDAETPLADGAVCPSTSDLSSPGHFKTASSASRSSGNSCPVFNTVKDKVISEGSSALLQNLAGFRNDAKQVASNRYKKKREETPEMLSPNSELQGNENKVLKDLTNACPDSFSSNPLEESPVHPSRRRKKSVCYAEPKLNSKLRRGDPFTITDFLSSPVYKTKQSEKSRKRMKRTMKVKEPSSDFVLV
ncbi:uncharacterized protein [Tiliqua scincoides]|uniref:uncharacterized protein n=1 Tax=Tiliqua scincoides TaxID=71010 RepID=UPI003461BD25